MLSKPWGCSAHLASARMQPWCPEGAAPWLPATFRMLASQLGQPALWALCAAAAELRIWPSLPACFTGDHISVLFIVSARSFMQMLMNVRPSFAPSRVPSTPPPVQPFALEFLFTVLQGISPLLDGLRAPTVPILAASRLPHLPGSCSWPMSPPAVQVPHCRHSFPTLLSSASSNSSQTCLFSYPSV